MLSVSLPATPRPSAPELTAIVAAARRAPSADNSQPWRIDVAPGGLRLTLETERAAVHHVGDALAQLALGSILESIDLAANAVGLAADVRASGIDGYEIGFDRRASRASDLAGVLDQRCTNRAPFDPSPLAAEVCAELAAEATGETHLAVVADRERRSRIADAAARAERLRFTRTPMSDLHRWLRFTPAEVERTKDGLDVRLLGLAWSELLALRVAGTDTGAAVLRALGGAHVAATRARSELLASGGLGVIAQPTLDSAAFVASGRALLRVWLRATRLGLAFAPSCAGVLLPLSRSFGARFEGHDADALASTDATIREVLHVPPSHHPVFLFRVGVPASVPLLRSARRDPGVMEDG